MDNNEKVAPINILSKGSNYRVIGPELLKRKEEDILVIGPPMGRSNSKDSFPFNEFKHHILDNLQNSLVYAITGTKSICLNDIKKTLLTVEEIINEEEYNRVMTSSRKLVISRMILDDEEKCTIEIESKSYLYRSSSIQYYDSLPANNQIMN